MHTGSFSSRSGWWSHGYAQTIWDGVLLQNPVKVCHEFLNKLSTAPRPIARPEELTLSSASLIVLFHVCVVALIRSNCSCFEECKKLNILCYLFNVYAPQTLKKVELMWHFTWCIYCSFFLFKGSVLTAHSHWLWAQLQLLCLAVVGEAFMLRLLLHMWWNLRCLNVAIIAHSWGWM